MSEKIFNKLMIQIAEYVVECVETSEPNVLFLALKDKGSVRIDIYRSDDTKAGKKLTRIIDKAYSSTNTVVKL